MIHFKKLTPLKAQRQNLNLSQETVWRESLLPTQTIRNYEDWRIQFKQLHNCIKVASALKLVNLQDPNIKNLLHYFKV